MAEDELRKLPGVDKILSGGQLKTFQNTYPQDLVTSVVRERIEQERRSILSGKACASADKLTASIVYRLEHLFDQGLRPVINATGVILHTNLGRAPLGDDVLDAMKTASTGYSNLEFDLDKGERGSRHTHIDAMLCRVTGAESSLVVNNNAAAVLVILSALAKRKEVIVSRGEAVEIGGGFRIPDVMKQSGVKLVEVGTTNCTYDHDYEQAVTARTAALLRVHTSNFKVEGFTHSTTVQEMVKVGESHELPVFDDLGSGCLLDTSVYGLAHEPTVQESIATGVAVACFSGDKLIGGPQAGIIVGKKVYIDKLKKNPLVRAMRVDKTRLAGLAVVLSHYLKGDAPSSIPVWRMISMPVSEIEKRAQRWAQALGGIAAVVDGESTLGGGSMPGSALPTKLVSIAASSGRKEANKASLLSQKLRHNDPPVIGRITADSLLLDPRTVLPGDDEAVVGALRKHSGLVK
jgi:L-seryl-tRNA(Ser) seleniumtransferase